MMENEENLNPIWDKDAKNSEDLAQNLDNEFDDVAELDISDGIFVPIPKLRRETSFSALGYSDASSFSILFQAIKYCIFHPIWCIIITITSLFSAIFLTFFFLLEYFVRAFSEGLEEGFLKLVLRIVIFILLIVLSISGVGLIFLAASMFFFAQFNIRLILWETHHLGVPRNKFMYDNYAFPPIFRLTPTTYEYVKGLMKIFLVFTVLCIAIIILISYLSENLSQFGVGKYDVEITIVISIFIASICLNFLRIGMIANAAYRFKSKLILVTFQAFKIFIVPSIILSGFAAGSIVGLIYLYDSSALRNSFNDEIAFIHTLLIFVLIMVVLIEDTFWVLMFSSRKAQLDDYLLGFALEMVDEDFIKSNELARPVMDENFIVAKESLFSEPSDVLRINGSVNYGIEEVWNVELENVEDVSDISPDTRDGQD